MFNRKLAVTLVKDKNAADTPVDTSTFDHVAETLVNTTAGIGFVVVLTAGALTGLRIVEQAAKYILK